MNPKLAILLSWIPYIAFSVIVIASVKSCAKTQERVDKLWEEKEK